jgi:hypothetical protein
MKIEGARARGFVILIRHGDGWLTQQKLFVRHEMVGAKTDRFSLSEE